MSAGVKCDHCGEFIPEDKAHYHLERRGMFLLKLNEQAESDFCGNGCLIEWAIALLPPEELEGEGD